MRKDLALPIVSLVILVVIVILGISYTGPGGVTEGPGQVSVAGRKKPTVPSGRQVYQVMQAPETWPKILQATIDPPDVHIGDRQKLEVVIQSPEKIVSVEARIETDHAVKVLPLGFKGETAGVMHERYAVKRNGQIVAATAGNGGSGTALAAELPKLRYGGEWIVSDTHDATYHTTFVVKDAAGRENSITMAWTDLCGIPNNGGGGSWTLSTPCAFSNTTDGLDNGTLVVGAGASIALTNSTLAFNSGRSISVSGGSLSIGTGSQIKEASLYAADADGDGYSLGSSWNTTGGTRKYLFSGSLCDCNDNNANVNPGAFYFTVATTTNLPTPGAVNFDYNCSGSEDSRFGTAVSTCVPLPPSCPCGGGSGNGGWDGGWPGCGNSGFYSLSCGPAGTTCLRASDEACLFDGLSVLTEECR